MKKGQPSVVDVAREAGVSLGTASRVFNAHPAVTADLREKVYAAARKLNFTPKISRPVFAVILGARRDDSFGYYQIMLTHLWQAAAERGVGIELISPNRPETARAPHIRGIISLGGWTRIAEGNGPPVVSINDPLSGKSFHHVYTDHRAQGRRAAEHCIERSHERIALLLATDTEWGARERLAGWRYAVEKAGLSADKSLISIGESIATADTVSHWIRNGVSAILNFNEVMAFDVLHVLSNVLEKRIGTDISVISVEDVPFYKYYAPPQTAIAQPLADMAHAAIDCLIAAPDAAPKRIEMPFILHERESVVRIGPQKKRMNTSRRK